ncbi:hypothetical protein FQ154_01760 [Paeniglutamicibacter gangotriensis]|uniref:Uncharacterized protein n=1 Tax=Paeniglutamicibacter gangotriensis TaxID=254787 RepID=A0A5B0EPY8_9MICC|nr:hypothetical protein [Paeniglutamicibacter gangotriensis]KAA0979911.1 hypothetical protein FQ154_01760 [Paeniglutamicibacter gangotriensis]
MDGFVPDYVLEEVCGTPALAATLVRAGLWNEVTRESQEGSSVSGESGWQFRNWSEYNPLRSELEEKREAERIRKANYRKSQKRPDNVPAGHPEGHQAESSPPDPTRPDPTPLSTEANASGGQAAEPEQLFSEPETPDALEPEESMTTNSQTIVAQWLENVTGPRPPSRVVGQLSKEIKNLLDEGHDYADVLTATQAWSRKASHPSILPSVLHEIRNPRTMTRGSEERLGAGLSLAQRAGRLNDQVNPFETKAITT